MLGKQVNNYHIVRVVAEGGMGTVYAAEHGLIGTQVAVKVLRPEMTADENMVNRFFNEARLMSGIQHPNIVDIMDFGTLPNGLPYLVMALLQGESLSARLERLKTLPIEHAIDLTLQVASALAAAHSAHVVHRDLKPENLFIVRDERDPRRELVKVLDFGIAKHRDDKCSTRVTTKHGAFLGTPAYMSPEQCRGVPDAVDQRSDIYALAVCLHEMVCGRPPFEAEGYGDVMMMQMTQPVAPLSQLRPDVPERVEAAVMKALAKDPNERFQTVSEFAAALDPQTQLLAAVHAPSISPDVTGPLLRRSEQSGTFVTPLGEDLELPSDPPLSLSRNYGRSTGLSSGLARGAATIPNAPATRADVTTDVTEHVDSSSSHFPWIKGLAAASGILLASFLLIRCDSEMSDPAGWLGGAAERASTSLHTLKTGPAVAQELKGAPDKNAGPKLVDEEVADGEGRGPTVVGLEASKRSGASGAGHELPVLTSESLPLVNKGKKLAVPQSATEVVQKPLAPRTRTVASSSKLATGKLDRNKSLTQKTAKPELPSSSTSGSSAKQKAESGRLRLDASPWAIVYLGGKMIGTTPLLDFRLPAGTHQLTLKNPEAKKSETLAVTIRPGQTTRRYVGWEK